MCRVPTLPGLALLLLAGLHAPASSPLAGQGMWANPQNLQVLPEDFPPDRLRAVMRGFSLSLGVRCSYCHVGEEGQPLSTYDFASDEHPNKDRTRAMYRMLGDINDHLAAIDPSGPERVNMWCGTCHNGKPRPMTLVETLSEAAALAGGDAAVERFLALRSQFYGGRQYDFRAPNVDAAGAALLARGDSAAAGRLFALNVEHHPDFAAGHERLGDLAFAQGDRDAAIRHYERALELAAGNGPLETRIRASLERARGGA